MPTRPPHPCPTCGTPTTARTCPAHRRASSAARLYGARWQRYRVAYLQRHPLCVLCRARGVTTAATVVDHITTHRGDPVLFWAPTNHRAVCAPCHNQRVDEGDFGR